MASKKTPVTGRKPGSIRPLKQDMFGNISVPGKGSRVPSLRAINDDRRPGTPDSLNVRNEIITVLPLTTQRKMRKSPVR